MLIPLGIGVVKIIKQLVMHVYSVVVDSLKHWVGDIVSIIIIVSVHVFSRCLVAIKSSRIIDLARDRIGGAFTLIIIRVRIGFLIMVDFFAVDRHIV